MSQEVPNDPILNHPNRRVIKQINFGAAEKVAKRKAEGLDLESFVEPVEDREFFYEGFRNLRAPARGRMPSIEAFVADGGAIRLADSLYDQGYRRHEELATTRWIPSAGMGGRVSEYDQGVWIHRNEDGSWPSMDPLDYIDPEDIKIVRDEEDPSLFRATHMPTGRYALGKSRVKANRELLEALEAIEEAAAGGDDVQVDD